MAVEKTTNNRQVIDRGRVSGISRYHNGIELDQAISNESIMDKN